MCWRLQPCLGRAWPEGDLPRPLAATHVSSLMLYEVHALVVVPADSPVRATCEFESPEDKDVRRATDD